MTIYQEAHAKIDSFPEETVQIIVQLMDKMKKPSTKKKTSEKKKRFLETAGKIDIDSDAILKLREESMI
ncbi:MAG: hypothetical protein IKI45_12605 [Oscillospiraceae bacterium]|nr:hypothetical protein [Oscillospiraceae bacterium]